MRIRAARIDLRLALAGVVVASTLSGCADLRKLTMTEDERRFFSSFTLNSCKADPSAVCIGDH